MAMTTATPLKNNWLCEQNNSSARASRFLVRFLDVHATNTTWTSQCDVLWRACTTVKFPFSFWTWIKSLRIQLQKKSSTFDKLTGSKWTRQSLKGGIFFLATFSLPSSSLLKFSIKSMVFQELMLYVLLVLMNRILVKLTLSRGIIKSLKYGTSASVKRSKSGTTTSGCFLKKKRKKLWFIMRKFCINGS